MKAHLVQRLRIPYAKAVDNPFTFGMMSHQHGCFTDEAWKIVNQAFAFDYMGAAEYEWGAVPKALEAMWQAGQDGHLVWGELDVKYPKRPGKKGLADGIVFYLCRCDDRQAVRRLIKRIALGNYRHSRDAILLDDALRRNESKPRDRAGWLDLDNCLMFFVDRKMFEDTLKLLGLISGCGRQS
jgi:hypothetical protein